MKHFSKKETGAILAGLRLLQVALETGRVRPDDEDIGTILTDNSVHESMTADEIDALCERINMGNAEDGAIPTVVLYVEGGVTHDVISDRPVRVVTLDLDIDGLDTDSVLEVNGQEVYASVYALTGPDEVGTGGINPEHVEYCLNAALGADKKDAV